MSMMRCQKKIIQTNKTKEKIIVICRGMKKAPSFEKGLGLEVGKLKSSNYANCFLKILSMVVFISLLSSLSK